MSIVTICPGTYVGNFTISRGMVVAGAGQGVDPAANTILSANQQGRVLLLEGTAGDVTLEKLRLTGGMLSNDYGAGIVSMGAGLNMTNCAVTANEGSNVSGVGIYSQSSLQMTGCLVSENACTSGGAALAGGIYAQGLTTLTDCEITGNTTTGDAGGLLVAAGLTTLAGQSTISENTAAGGGGIVVASGASLTIEASCQVTHNTATELYGGIANEGVVTLQGNAPATIVVNNCPDNCLNVPGCSNAQVDCPD
ncbi:MAG: hypothetical protein R2853_21540 [Thermomicrobiales bacterium]